ncbi:MAG TPA: hypothetical protein DEP46_08540 [Blastocatellia bacterium]|nr:hypothetical protein [Blastocatellia bacterium]
MQKVLTAAEMREVDRLTTERYGIPSIILMENAAHAVARVITEKLGGSVKGKSILILCGKGNNGGDGFALARVCRQGGASVTVCFLFPDEEIGGDAKQNLKILRNLHSDQTYGTEAPICLAEVGTHRSFFDPLDPFLGPDVVVDAVFGTGLVRPLDDELSVLARQYNSCLSDQKRPLFVSVDIPSGLPSDTEFPIGEHFNADITVTFTSPKPANVLVPAARSCGELLVANIGSPQELIDEQPSQLYLAEREDAATWLKRTRFSSDSYKNKRGHALLIAGSENYSGAAVLAANAAMRSGVGLVTLVTPGSSKVSVESRVLPEVIVRGAAETDGGAIAEEAYDELGNLIAKADAVAIGSGMSQGESTAAFVRRAVAECRQPLILDADALNVLAPLGANWPTADAAEPPKGGTPNVILTPHEGEFLRLLGDEENHRDGETPPPLLRKERSKIKDRVAAVREFAQTHDVILVLKGERVLIGHPDGRVVVNPTGNSGLGKAGNGDTLAGILAGFVAQAAKMDTDIFETVVAAVYIAGTAGDIAETKFGKRVMTASDVRECLTEVFAELEKG